MKNGVFGWGGVVENYRFDGATIYSKVNSVKIDTSRTKLGCIVGEAARIGVNVSIMPGIKIGSHTFIGSSVIVSEDLPDNKFIEYQKKITRIVDNRVNRKTGNIEDNRKKMNFYLCAEFLHIRELIRKLQVWCWAVLKILNIGVMIRGVLPP